VVAAKTTDLKPNEGRIFKFGSKPGILVQTADGEYRAFSATCTHLDCTVQFRTDEKMIWCACHNGRYDLTGKTFRDRRRGRSSSFRSTCAGRKSSFREDKT